MVDSLGRSFGEVTQRYVVGGTISSRPALVSLKHVRNILVKSGVTTIQINDPNQDYGVYESIAQLQNILGIPVGDGSGVTGGGVTNDTLYIVNDGGVSPPDTFLIDLASLADGNGIYDGSGTVPDGTVAAIDSGIVFQGDQTTTLFQIDMDQGLYGTDYTQNDNTAQMLYYDVGGSNKIYVDNAGATMRADGPDKILLNGAVQITDLVTDPPTKLVGADVDGDLSQVILGTNLSLSGDTLNASGGSGGISGTGLTNRLAYWTASGAIGYESTLRVDSTNNRLGVGAQTAPTATLDVTGTASGSNVKGAWINSTLTATANNDAYAALQVDGTFVPGAFTGTRPLIAAFVGSTSAAKPYLSFYQGTSVSPPSIRFYRNSGTSLSTGTLRSSFAGSGLVNTTTTYNEGSDFDGFQIALGSSQLVAWASLLGTGDLMPVAVGQTKTVSRFRGLIFSEEVVIGSDNDAGSNATGGTLRSGHKNNTGTNTGGSNLTIQAGRGNGNSTLGGNIIFQTPSLEASGTTYQTYATVATATRTNRNFLIGHTTDASARLDVNGSGSTSSTDAANFANSNDSTILRVRNDRRVGINTATPDVSFDMGADTDGFKMQAGTTAQRPSINNTQRVNTDSLKAEIRLNGTWEIINSGLRSNKALDFPSTAASSYSDLTITVTGASPGDVCSLGVPQAGQIGNVLYMCYVSAADVVTVRLLNNEAAGVADPTSGTFKVFVTK